MNLALRHFSNLNLKSFIFYSVLYRVVRTEIGHVFIHLEYKMLILTKKLRKFSDNSDFREKLGTIKRPMKNFQGFELENIIDELGNTMFPTWRPNEPVILNVFDFGLQFNSNLSFLMLIIPWLLTFFQK